MQILPFSAGTVERKDYMLKIIYTSDKTISLKDMQEIKSLREQLFGDEKYCSLIDLTKDLLSLTPEAKQFAAEDHNVKKFRIAEALLVKNFAQKLGVQTYVKLFRSKDRVKVVMNEAEAEQWLNKEYEKYMIRCSAN